MPHNIGRINHDSSNRDALLDSIKYLQIVESEASRILSNSRFLMFLTNVFGKTLALQISGVIHQGISRFMRQKPLARLSPQMSTKAAQTQTNGRQRPTRMNSLPLK